MGPMRNLTALRGHIHAGTRFGRLTVLERLGSDRFGRSVFLCLCDCGTECSVRGADLRSKHSKSRGCLRGIAIQKRHEPVQLKEFGTVFVLGKADPEHQHGVAPATLWVVVCKVCGRRCFEATTKQLRAGTARCECLKRTYTSWRQMIQRCTNKNHDEYHHYGGRGIKICERWRWSFLSFAQDMGPRPEGKTLDRIDTDSGYKPGNCRWGTFKQQAATRRRKSID